MPKKIISCFIGPYPRPMPEGMFDQMPSVQVDYSDGTKEKLFTFYPDELHFTVHDFVGKTREEALALRQQRDTEYLRS